MKFSHLGLGFVIGACLAGCTPVEKGPPHNSSAGSVQGIVQDGIHVFYDLPYAQPPVGKHRWRAPRPNTAWSGQRDATEQRPFCLQPVGDSDGNLSFLTLLLEGSGMAAWQRLLLRALFAVSPTPDMSEDCLFLTIRTPNLNPDEKLPVMFWIHGGGHRFGSGNQGFTDSNALAQRGVVQVSINYRLGIWGFYAHPELVAEDPNNSAGNYGLLDQIAALDWVQAHIASFGGNPDNVTIFGESAGGHSVGQLMASPLAEGRFHAAIAQSGTGAYQFQHLHKDIETPSGASAGVSFAALTGITGDDQLPRLRALSVEEISAHENSDPAIAATYHPQVDSWALLKTTAESFASGEQHPVPFLTGSNADEGSVLGQLIPFAVDGMAVIKPTDPDAWNAYLTEHLGAEVAQIYAANTAETTQTQSLRLLGDAMFGRHAYQSSLQHAQFGNDTYLYFFSRTPESNTQSIGATHALDLQPLYDRFLPFWPKDDRDDELGRQMRAYWTNFAKFHDPNDASATDLPHWPKFSLFEPRELHLGHDQTEARKVARMAIYSALWPQQEARVRRAIAAAN